MTTETCVAFFDRPKHAPCPNAKTRTDGLCAEHGAAWQKAVNDRWGVTLHD